MPSGGLLLKTLPLGWPPPKGFRAAARRLNGLLEETLNQLPRAKTLADEVPSHENWFGGLLLENARNGFCARGGFDGGRLTETS